LVVPLLAVKIELLGLEATEPKSISSTVAPLNTAAVQVAVMVILTLKFLVSVAAFAAETAKAKAAAAANWVNFMGEPFESEEKILILDWCASYGNTIQERRLLLHVRCLFKGKTLDSSHQSIKS
jgi:hypothetical protein